MSKRWIVVAVGVLVVAGGLAFVATRAHYVNTDVAVSAGNQFFSLLQARNLREAAAMYDDRFRRQQGELWDGLLASLDAKQGPVTKAALASVQIVPIEKTGCVLLQYQVSRGTLASDENLIMCPSTKGQTFRIVGHELTRLDTKQSIAAGVKVTLRGVRLP